MTEQPEPIAQLIAKLDSDPQTRFQIKQQLLARSEDIVEPLIQVLLSEEGRKSYAAAEILGELADARALQPLIATLKTRNSLLGSGVVKALCQYEGMDVLPYLVEALPGANMITQQTIVLSLQGMQDPRAVTELTQQLHATDSPALRTAIIKVLIELGDATILSHIQRYTDDPDQHVRDWVQEAQTRFSGG
jgi:HEAT repeat protein